MEERTWLPPLDDDEEDWNDDEEWEEDDEGEL